MEAKNSDVKKKNKWDRLIMELGVIYIQLETLETHRKKMESNTHSPNMEQTKENLSLNNWSNVRKDYQI